ncbi:DUF4041 domain-containing protein [Streptomyces mirabilis]|uniref:DUF4041 domain-containing protein n=1 Tax=Streptomyces mirabilis TaxID=68239 RepID=UPI00332F6BDA
MRFNPPPGWPTPPEGWTPPQGWKPDPAWPAPPPGWQLFVTDDASASDNSIDVCTTVPSPEDAAGPTPETLQSRQDQTPADPPTAQPVNGVDPAPLLARIAALEAEFATAHSGAHVIDLSDQRALQDVGIYRYHHPLENAAAYKERLHSLEGQIDEVIKSGRAILAADMFTFDGSLARGRKLVGDLSKLMLRAYNAETDNCVRSLRSGNVRAARKRLESAVTAIEKLGVIMEMRISPEYHALRITELELTADFQMKVQEERERARQERQLLREQRRAEQELAAEKERLEKERAHYISVLDSLRAKGDDTAVTELSRRLADIEKAIAANDYRIANIRAGYVYVISNLGAFGPNIVKIGMTRRLEPMDRVRELGDASVPFRYDVHAMFFSEDAVTLESELHKAFAARRVNFVNERREFFFATPSEVRALLADKVGGLLEFTEEAPAPEYFQSRSRWPQQS